MERRGREWNCRRSGGGKMGNYQAELDGRVGGVC